MTNFQHPFPKRIPYKDFSYSDHEAIMATFKFIPGKLINIVICMICIIIIYMVSYLIFNLHLRLIYIFIIIGEFQTINVDVKDSIKEAISICETSLKTVRRRRFWYLLVGCILIIPLVWSMGLDCSFTSLDVTIGLNVIRIFLTAILCYILFMSSLWNSVETNALKAGCLGMEIYLANLNNNLCKK